MLERISNRFTFDNACYFSSSAKEFESLDGIGPVLAERIVSYRKTNGPFSAIEDLLKVQGIGQNTFAKFKAKLRV